MDLVKELKMWQNTNETMISIAGVLEMWGDWMPLRLPWKKKTYLEPMIQIRNNNNDNNKLDYFS